MAGFIGNSKRNILKGTSLPDFLSGLAGNDDLFGGGDDDRILGGLGSDRLFGLAGDDKLNGDAGNDFIDGGTGNDTARGGAGDDRILAGAGNDVLDGGGGNHRLVGDAGNDTATGGFGNDRIEGGTGLDTLDGGAGNDTLFGGALADNLTGGTGNDKLNGDAGNDVLNGGAGADAFNGGLGVDTVAYARDAASPITIDLSGATASQFGEAAGDTFNGIENAIGTDAEREFSPGSNAFVSDTIIGTAGANVLDGLGGNDTLWGLAGPDILIGGGGTDILRPGGDADIDQVRGGTGGDFVDYTDALAGVVVDLGSNPSLTITVGGAATGDVLSSIESVIGSAFGDTLTPFPRGSVDGGAGNDVLSPSFASSTSELLSGGAGADRFVVKRSSFGTTVADLISDFSQVDGDKFRIDSQAQFPIGPTLDAGELRVVAGVVAANAANPQFIYETISRTLYFDADGTGAVSAPQVLFAFFGGPATLTIADFEVI